MLNVIIGLGETGLSCLRYLLKRGELFVAVTDSRSNPPCLEECQKEFPSIPISVGGFDKALLEKATRLIISPGVSVKEPIIAQQVEKGIPIIGDIELFAQQAKAPIVAITGSNGKSTVTSWVGDMTRCSGKHVIVGGNLGEPILNLLEDKEPDFYVVELSSFQLETTYSLKAAVATVLNTSEDHMDRYASLKEYIAVKQRIYHHCQIAVINRDDLLGPSLASKTISFGLGKPQANEFGLIDGYLAYGKQKLLASSELRVRGLHQMANALAALAIGTAIKLPMSAMLESLKKFPGLVHRCQWLKNSRGVDWYNDSKATNVGATYAALAGLGSGLNGKIVLIAGGQSKGASFVPLKGLVAKYVRKLVLIGEDASKLQADLKMATMIVIVDSLEKAVDIAKVESQPGDIVLLSPACASLDMFDNFAHRGRVFTELVEKL